MLFNKINFNKEIRLFLIGLLIAIIVGLNFYMLNKITANSKLPHEQERSIISHYHK